MSASIWKPNGGTQVPDYFVSVKDFPYLAKGDGSTNDTLAIQAAMDAVRSAGGGRLYIPKGIYIIDKALRLGSKTLLFGDGAAASIFKASQTAYVGTNGATYADQTCQMLQNYNFSASSITDLNLQVQDIGFDWGAVTIAGGGAHSISFRYVDNVSIERVTAIGGENVTALLACKDTYTYYCEGVNQKNCYFDHWDGIGDAFVVGCVGRTNVDIAQGIQFTGTGSFSEARTSINCVIAFNRVYNVRDSGGSSSAIIANANQAASGVLRFLSYGNYVEDADLGLVYQGAVGQHISAFDTFVNVDGCPIFMVADGSGSPSNCTVFAPHLIDCDHSVANVALISLSGTNNKVCDLRVTNTGTAAYTVIGYLTAAAVDCEISVLTAPTGAGARFSDAGTNTRIYDKIQNVPIMHMAKLGNYANDAAAAAGGVPVGGQYRNGSVLQVRVS